MIGPASALLAAVSALVLSVVAAPSAVRAQAAEGRISALMDGADLTWTLGSDDPEAESHYAPQTGPFVGMTTLTLRGAGAGGGMDGAILVEVLVQPVDGIARFVTGGIFFMQGGDEWGWEADLDDPSSEFSIESYALAEGRLTVSGRFAATGLFVDASLDEPDPTRGIDMTGTFEAVLPPMN